MKKTVLLYTGFGLVVAILASIVLMSHWYMKQWSISDRREERAFQIIRTLDTLLVSLNDARRSQHVFIKTGKREYVSSFHQAAGRAEQELSKLTALAKDQPWLQQRMGHLVPLVKKKLAERKGVMERGVSEAASSTGKVSSEEIRKLVAALQDETISELRLSSEKQNRDLRKVQQLLLAKSTIIFVLLTVLFVLLKADAARRIRNETELLRHRDELDGLVKTRTRELLELNQQLQVEINEHSRTESLLQDAHRRLLDTLESMTDGFVSLDRKWCYTYVNAAAARLLGKSPPELLGRVCWEVFPEAAEGEGRRELHRSMAEQRMVAFEEYAPGPPPRWYENRCFPSPEGMAVYFSDITDRKRAERLRRDFTEHEESIQEQERLALSREIHDQIGQGLTALKLDLSWIGLRVPEDAGELAAQLAEMHRSLGELIDTTRTITARLRPPLLDNLGIAAAVDWQVRDFGRRSGIKFHLDVDEEIGSCDEHLSTALLRILRESLTNVACHSGASDVSVSLRRGDGAVTLEVSDNGSGIDHEKASSPTAFGIMGMRERAHLCGGDLTIMGAPGGGTIVVCSIPFSAEREMAR